MHGDISSANVLVASTQRIKLAGFRAAEISAAGSAKCAPRRDDADAAKALPDADVYALAMCLWELATVRPPMPIAPLAMHQRSLSPGDDGTAGGLSPWAALRFAQQQVRRNVRFCLKSCCEEKNKQHVSFAHCLFHLVVWTMFVCSLCGFFHARFRATPFRVLRLLSQVRDHEANVQAASLAMKECGLSPHISELIVRCWLPETKRCFGGPSGQPTPEDLVDAVMVCFYLPLHFKRILLTI